jgi:hypothetical protein
MILGYGGSGASLCKPGSHLAKLRSVPHFAFSCWLLMVKEVLKLSLLPVQPHRPGSPLTQHEMF